MFTFLIRLLFFSVTELAQPTAQKVDDRLRLKSALLNIYLNR